MIWVEKVETSINSKLMMATSKLKKVYLEEPVC